MNDYWQKIRLYHLLNKNSSVVDPNATLWERSRLYHVLKEKGIIK